MSDAGEPRGPDLDPWVQSLVAQAREDLPPPDALRTLEARVRDAARAPSAGLPRGLKIVPVVLALLIAGWLAARGRVAPTAGPAAPATATHTTETRGRPAAAPPSLPAPDARVLGLREDPADRAPAATSATPRPVAAPPIASRGRRPSARARTLAPPTPAPTPAPAPAPTPIAPPAPPQDAETQRLREAQLLLHARHALETAPATALALTEQHRTEFPDGQHVQDREVIAVDALLRLGRRDEAVRRAGAFRARFPGSAMTARLDALVNAAR
jgi:hypothetical protein